MDEIVNRYRTVCNSNSKGRNAVVIGVENPMGSFTIGWIKHLVFGRCFSHVLNAGAYMGPAGTVQRLLQIILLKQDNDDQKTLDHSLLLDVPKGVRFQPFVLGRRRIVFLKARGFR